MNKIAIISPCKKYRYLLSRSWAEGNEQTKTVTFVMLNPSTADAKEDDPTITRCIGFAKSWGYNRLNVVNLYAYRATKPSSLWAASYPEGGLNQKFLENAEKNSNLIILAWGNHGSRNGRGNEVAKIFSRPYVLELTKHGQPRHPLYMPLLTKPVPYIHKKEPSE